VSDAFETKKAAIDAVAMRHWPLVELQCGAVHKGRTCGGDAGTVYGTPYGLVLAAASAVTYKGTPAEWRLEQEKGGIVEGLLTMELAWRAVPLADVGPAFMVACRRHNPLVVDGANLLEKARTARRVGKIKILLPYP
jgi:hypothetical protein